jgi:allophanate hydrolase subunit 1
MKDYPIKIIPYSAHALLIQWPEEIDEDILQDVLAFKARLEGAFPEALLTPCYHSLLLVFRNLIKDLTGTIEAVLAQYEKRFFEPYEARVFEIAVDYQSEVGMDLEEVCQALNMSIPTFIDWHTSALYTVYGLGYLSDGSTRRVAIDWVFRFPSH